MTLPFAGVRVLEVAAWTFVPGAGAALADLGADVIKVEPPAGDPQRGLMNLLGRAGGPVANPFLEIPNRGKRSITLDLTTPDGHAVLLDLAATADVFLTSYLPAVRTKLAIDVADLRAANPQIVYAAGSGWGARGPMADTGGFDLASAWASASMAFRMSRDGGEPMYQPAAFFDLQGSNTIAGAIGTALFHRERTGETTEIDVSLLNVGMWALAPDIMAAPFVGTVSQAPRGSVPNPLVNSYATADGRWLYLVCLQSDRYWLELCEILDRPDLAADARFVDMASRTANAVVCIAELDASFATAPLAEWQRRLARFGGVWAAAVTPAEVHDHVQVAANGYLPEVTTSTGATYRLTAPPMQFGGEAPVPRSGAPELGEHTHEILLELGLDWDAIAALAATGAIG